VSRTYGRYWSSGWVVLACPVLVLGLFWSWAAVVAMLVVALMFSSVICGSAPTAPGTPHPSYGGVPFRQIVRPALRWAVIAVAVVLTMVTSPWLGVLVLVALVGTSPWAVQRLRRHRSLEDDDLSPERIRGLVRQLDVAGLCLAWRSSHQLLGKIHDVEARAKLVMLRQEYLDEMERRDSQGFHEWLEVARDTDDPEVFLTERPGDDGATAA